MKLTAKLPEGTSNGLAALEDDLVTKPARTVVAVVILDVHKLTTDCDTDDVEPTVRIRQIEALTTDLDKQAARRLLDAAHARRIGGQTLPLDGMVPLDDDEDGEDDQDVDPETGEVRAS